jgi:hypothetical protein
MRILSLLCLLIALNPCLAIEDHEIVAAGEWSASVEGGHGNTIRGRLLLCASPKNHRPAVYLELQDCAEVWGNVASLYCDLRPGGGCKLEYRDASGHSLAPVPFAYGGGAPGAAWINVPCDSTVRLRLSLYADLPAVSTVDYFVSGTFSVVPQEGSVGLDVWRGTLKLPAMKIPVPKP